MNSLIQIISALLNIISWLVIIDVIMSLLIQFRILDQRNQIVSQIWLSIRNIMEPIYSKIRSFLPKTIGFDLAPAVLLFGIFALQVIIKNNFYQY
jgi:YggT family protein